MYYVLSTELRLPDKSQSQRSSSIFSYYTVVSTSQRRIQGDYLGSTEPSILSFCAHASPASCAHTSAVENILNSGPPFHNPRSATASARVCPVHSLVPTTFYTATFPSMVTVRICTIIFLTFLSTSSQVFRSPLMMEDDRAMVMLREQWRSLCR